MSGPYLYDDEPERLHTAEPRKRNGQLIALLVATVLLALAAVVGLFVVRGSPAEQSEEAVGVFLAALADGDDETAHGLLCAGVRAGTSPGEVPPEYRLPLPARVLGSTETEAGGAPAYDVEIRWADGATTSVTVVNENGPHLCGASPAA